MEGTGEGGGKERTWNLIFLYWTVSTLNPMVGIVVTTSPICRRYNIVVFPLSCPPRELAALEGELRED